MVQRAVVEVLNAVYEAKRELVVLGAYTKGTDKELDEALLRMPRIEAYLSQSAGERTPFDESVAALASLVRSSARRAGRVGKPAHILRQFSNCGQGHQGRQFEHGAFLRGSFLPQSRRPQHDRRRNPAL